MGPSRDGLLAAIGDLRLRNDRQLAIAGQVLLLIPAVWFIQTDFQLYHGDWEPLKQRLILRALLIGLPIVSIGFLRSAQTRERYSTVVLWLSLVLTIVTVALNAQRPVASGLPMRGPLLVLCVQYFTMPDRLIRQSIGPLLLSLAVIVLRLTKLNGVPPDIAGDIVALLIFNAVGILTVRRREELEIVSDTAVRDLRALGDIIPICSHCRKLRTEVGQWKQLEQYFRERSDTLFSHGICPDCLAKVYETEHLPIKKG